MLLIDVSVVVSGFIKFLGPYYMILITKRRKIGSICGHAIYAVSKSEMITVPHSSVHVQSSMDNSKNEKRSFVNSACNSSNSSSNCNLYMVLVKRPVSIRALGLTLYLDEDSCHHLIVLCLPNKINVQVVSVRDSFHYK